MLSFSKEQCESRKCRQDKEIAPKKIENLCQKVLPRARFERSREVNDHAEAAAGLVSMLFAGLLKSAGLSR
jgi:hypothetical protein